MPGHLPGIFLCGLCKNAGKVTGHAEIRAPGLPHARCSSNDDTRSRVQREDHASPSETSVSTNGNGRRTAESTAPKLSRRHAARLRLYWATNGWAHHDTIDIDLLDQRLILQVTDSRGAAQFVLTDAGREALGASLSINRDRRRPHARIVDGVAQHLHEAGRLVFTELAVRTQGDSGWRSCKPDVFSLVRGLRDDHLAAQVHEVKVSRADLLNELRSDKTKRYHELAGQIFLVLRDGIARVDEIPPDYGVVVWDGSLGYTLARDAPARAYALQTRHWMAMAKSVPFAANTVSEPRQQAF